MRNWLRLGVAGACLMPLALTTSGSQSAFTLAGVVVLIEDQTVPVRRAVVTLTGGDIETNVAAVTDDQGRFAFSNLRPGRYRLAASKPAFVSAEYGAAGPGKPGMPITLASGAQTPEVRIALARGAVITGVVRDSRGAPAAGVSVRAIDRADAGGVGGSSEDAGVTTDDLGVYRIYGLAPGEYLVVMTPYQSLREARKPSSADIDRMLRALEQRRSGRGAAQGLEAPGDSRRGVYAPIYHPGTPFVSEAGVIRLSAGEVRDAVDFTPQLFSVATVSGTVSSLDGAPVASTRITITAVGPPLRTFNFAMSSTLDASGRFDIPNVPPGRYVLMARNAPGGGRGRTGAPPGGSPSEASMSWALAEVTVRGEDVTNVSLTLRPPIRVGGRVTFDASHLNPPDDVTQMRIGFRPVQPADGARTLPDGTPLVETSRPMPAGVRADGTFETSGLLPGLYVPISSVPGASGPSGWWLRSAMLDGRDLLDLPLAVGASSLDLSELVLTFSDRHSELAGALEGQRGQSATDYVVVVVPADRALWRPGARRIQFARPATDGTFSIVDLPAGEYLMAVLTDLDPEDLAETAFLEQLVSQSVPITIRDGERTVQNLRIGARRMEAGASAPA